MKLNALIGLALAAGIFVLPAPATATMADECFARCDAMQEEYDALHDSTNDQAAVSGGKTNQLSDLGKAIETCRNQCSELAAAQKLFTDCLARNPNNPEWVDYCREDYRENRPNHSW